MIDRLYIKYLMTCLLATLLLTACSDDIFNDGSTESNGMQFSISTIEMGDEMIGLGETRSASSLTADRFVEHVLEGDNPSGLKVHREPLPLVGIHRGAANMPVAATRAAANEVVSTTGTNFHDSLTIWGYTNNNTELFDQILLTKVRNWRNSVEWPYRQGDYMKFYAVAPSLEEINMSATAATYTAAPTLTYTLPEEVSEMRDVLYGESDNISIASGPTGSVTTNPQQENLGKDNKFIDLRFRHILTAIRFSQGTIPANLTITEISVTGINTKGTYHPASNDAATGTDGTWSDLGTSGTYAIETSWVGTGSSGSENVYIDHDVIMFMLPQAVPAEAKLQITLSENLGGGSTKSHTLTCSISGDVWKKGYTVNYKITIGRLKEGYYFTAEDATSLEHSNTVVNSSLGVHSYYLYSDYSSGTKSDSYSPVTWDVNGYSTTVGGTYAIGNKPTWLTEFRGVPYDSYYAGGNDATASFTVARQEMAVSTSHDVVLSENSKAGAASSLDLSTHNPDRTEKGTTETANCYIVNRSGSYKFPLVYGNKTTEETEADCFKDHTGTTISHRLIKDQITAKNSGFTYELIEGDKYKKVEYVWDAAATASDGGVFLRGSLLWQDVPNLIKTGSVSALSSSNEMQFEVGNSTPGNAVIALQARKKITYYKKVGGAYDFDETQGNSGYGVADEWETLWTWHIWMTDEWYKNDGTENGISYDTYYVNGTESGSGKHIASLKNSTGDEIAQILPVNLGWVPDEMDFGLYKPREIWVELKQTGSEDTTKVKITQEARQTLYTGTGTVYQWGRPTAFPAFRTVDGKLRTIYDIDGNDITNRFVMAQTSNPGDAIGKPYEILQWETNQNAWFDVGSADYATANAMWNSTTKTVYDPCPPGFRVPPVSIFTGFSKKGTTVVNEAEKLNMWPDSLDLNGVTQKNGERSKGGYFYCTPNETERYGKMVYMPATGEWHGNKTVGTLMSDITMQLNNINGIYWTADYKQDASSQACGLWITPEYTFSAGTADKPVIGFFDKDHKFNYYSSVRAIRPMKIVKIGE